MSLVGGLSTANQLGVDTYFSNHFYRHFYTHFSAENGINYTNSDSRQLEYPKSPNHRYRGNLHDNPLGVPLNVQWFCLMTCIDQ